MYWYMTNVLGLFKFFLFIQNIHKLENRNTDFNAMSAFEAIFMSYTRVTEIQ